MSRPSTITQSDIARLAGVTRLTVRRALQGQPGVGETTASRIRRLAKDHGYLPNAAATATRTGRFNAVGLLVGSVTPRYLPAELVHGVEASLFECDCQLLFSSLSDQKLRDERFMPRVLQHLMVDGLLIHYTHRFPGKLPSLITSNRVPSIWINTRLKRDCVYLDDEAGAYRATKVLLEHGHRRITYVNRDSHGHYSEADRLAGYNRAMQEAGLEPTQFTLTYPRHEAPRDDTRFADANQWLSGPDRPTAVLTYSGSLAGPIAAAALAHGLSIPRDLSIIAFDRVTFSPVGIPLTCVQTSMEPLAEVAVDMLFRRIEHPSKTLPARSMEPELTELVSVAPVRDAVSHT